MYSLGPAEQIRQGLRPIGPPPLGPRSENEKRVDSLRWCRNMSNDSSVGGASAERICLSLYLSATLALNAHSRMLCTRAVALLKRRSSRSMYRRGFVLCCSPSVRACTHGRV